MPHYLGSIVVGLLILVAILLAVRSVYRNKKRGGCINGCENCVHKDDCKIE